MIIWFNPIGIKRGNQQQAIDFILEKTKIPTDAAGDHDIHYALFGKVNISEEQDWWECKAALRILNGASPADIAITTNKESRLLLNMQLAERLGIKFPMGLLQKATLIEELPKEEKAE